MRMMIAHSMVVAALCATAPAWQGATPQIELEDVPKHVGEQVALCGVVVSYSCDSEHFAQLDLDEPYWKGAVSIGVKNDQRGAFGPFFEDTYLWSLVCAAGRLERTGKRYVLMLAKPDAIVIREARKAPLHPLPVDAVQSCTPKVQQPILTLNVPPSYTAEGIRQKIQGFVLLDAVVLPNGSIGNVRIIHSLDSASGLDQQAVAAVKRWHFRPGSLDGKPVPVVVQVQMSFTLK